MPEYQKIIPRVLCFICAHRRYLLWYAVCQINYEEQNTFCITWNIIIYTMHTHEHTRARVRMRRTPRWWWTLTSFCKGIIKRRRPRTFTACSLQKPYWWMIGAPGTRYSSSSTLGCVWWTARSSPSNSLIQGFQPTIFLAPWLRQPVHQPIDLPRCFEQRSIFLVRVLQSSRGNEKIKALDDFVQNSEAATVVLADHGWIRNLQRRYDSRAAVSVC